MTSENFEELLQLIKDDITKENTKMRELIPPRLELAITIGFLSTEKPCKSYVYEYYSFYSTMNIPTFIYFRAFVFSILSSLINTVFYFPQKLLLKKSTDLSSIH